MGRVVIEHEPCPACSSTNVRPYWWHLGQAWLIVCQECKHEAGREDREGQAWAVWDREAIEARPPEDSTDGDDDVPLEEADDLPDAAALGSAGAGKSRADCGPCDRDVPCDPASVVASLRAEVASLRRKLEAARPEPLRTYWHCSWSSRERYDREQGRNVVSTAPTLEALYEELAAKRIAHLHDECGIGQVHPGMEPVGEVSFAYGPIRLMAVEEERDFDEGSMEASSAWTDFHARHAEHEARRRAEEIARFAEESGRSTREEEAEYLRLKGKFEGRGPA